MSNPYSALLEPGRIGSLELRNRIVLGPMGTNFAEADGRCGERIQGYYEERARGGAGLLTMGVCSIAYPNGTAEPHQVALSRDEFIPGLAEITRRVHAHGAKIAVQLQHAGRIATRDFAQGRPAWVPSIPPKARTTMMSAFTHEELATFVGAAGAGRPQFRVLDKADIEQLIEWFAAAAARAQAAGFDGVEVHAGHSYILAGFLSPYYNQREDEYGGSLEKRARLLLETIRAVKARVGASFPVWVRLDGEELRRQTNDNPVFYVQYAHARTSNVARLAAEDGVRTEDGFDPSLLSDPTEAALLAILGDYPRVVAQAASLLEPHRVARYLENLAAHFHKWYDTCRVRPMNADEPVTDLHRTRLWLNDATRVVLANGLELLGVSAPERM